MALQTLPYLVVPDPRVFDTAGADMLIDAAGEKAAFCLRVGKAGDIHKIHFRLGTVTTGQTLKASLQDLDASGDPDGVIDQSGTVAVADTDDDAWKTVILGVDRTVAVGAMLAVVIEYNTTVGTLIVKRGTNTLNYGNAYCDLYTTLWTKSTAAPIVKLEYSDGTVYHQQGVQTAIAGSIEYHTASAVDERALRFQLPFPARCLGLAFHGRLNADAELVLYNAGGALATAVLESDHKANSTDLVYSALFATPQSLSANTTYYAALKPTVTPAVVRLYEWTAVANADFAGMSGGTGFYTATRADAGAWTEVNTQRPQIFLLLDQFDDAASGGLGVLGG